MNRDGVQMAALDYPGLAQSEIFDSVEAFYRRFYFRPRKIVAMVGGMLRDPAVMRRRLREGAEFFRFLRERRVELARGPARGLERGRLIGRRPMSVLFVCRGNVCRSRVGEQIFQVLSLERRRPGRPRGALGRRRSRTRVGARSPDGMWSGPT